MSQQHNSEVYVTKTQQWSVSQQHNSEVYVTTTQQWSVSQQHNSEVYVTTTQQLSVCHNNTTVKCMLQHNSEVMSQQHNSEVMLQQHNTRDGRISRMGAAEKHKQNFGSDNSKCRMTCSTVTEEKRH